MSQFWADKERKKSPLGLDPMDAEMIERMRVQTEAWRRNMRMFDSLPIEEQERIMLEIQKQQTAERTNR